MKTRITRIFIVFRFTLQKILFLVRPARDMYGEAASPRFFIYMASASK